MKVTLFKDLTTEEYLSDLELEAASYDGLYVEMNDAPQRKYVKEKAKKINDLIKAVDRARIDKPAEFKASVNDEAKFITDRLASANKPFTMLIDEYNISRAKVLEAEKERKKAVELAVKLDADHEFALLMNSKFDRDLIDKLESERVDEERREIERLEREKQLIALAAKEANAKAELAKQAELAAIESARQQKIQAENDRVEADAQAARQADLVESLRVDALKKARQNEIDAAERAKNEQIAFQQAEEIRVANEMAAREADVTHKAKVNNAILAELMANGISEKDGKTMVKLAAKRQLPQLTINY